MFMLLYLFFFCDFGSNRLQSVCLILPCLDIGGNSAFLLYRAISESFVKLFTLNTQGPEEYQSTFVYRGNASTSANGLNITTLKTFHKNEYIL